MFALDQIVLKCIILEHIFKKRNYDAVSCSGIIEWECSLKKKKVENCLWWYPEINSVLLILILGTHD